MEGRFNPLFKKPGGRLARIILKGIAYKEGEGVTF
jgi:hypothetical protein